MCRHAVAAGKNPTRIEIMEYKRFKNTIIVRIDKGEEIVSSLGQVAAKEGVLLASVSALGAVGSFTAGVFLPQKKEYLPNEFRGDFEIVSLTGTVTEKDGAPYLHLHISCAAPDGKVVGGHLTRAVVSVTCEAVLTCVEGRAGRRFDGGAGINLIEFD